MAKSKTMKRYHGALEGLHFTRPLPLWVLLTADAEYGGEAEKWFKRQTVFCCGSRLTAVSYRPRQARSSTISLHTEPPIYLVLCTE